MTPVDWAIAIFVVVLAAMGFLRGFIAGAMALVGLVGGAFLGTRLAPTLLAEGSASPYAPLLGLAGAILGGALLGGAGAWLRDQIRSPGIGVFDGLLGALLSGAVALALVWIAGAVALQTPGARELRKDIQRSEILGWLNGHLPPTGPILNTLARFDPFPQIEGPDAGVPAPSPRIARDPDVRAAGASVVRVLGTACGLGVSGSGWVAGPELVVTNAHVVAGQDDTTVQLRGEGDRLDAEAVAFDTLNDVAVLRVPGLQARALPLARETKVGTSGAILGFPRNGPYDVRAGRLGPTQTVISQDAYGRGPVKRSITALRGTVRPGNSGGPFVDADGNVATTIFAARTGGGPRGGYGVPDGVVRQILGRVGDAAVDTGPCVG